MQLQTEQTTARLSNLKHERFAQAMVRYQGRIERAAAASSYTPDTGRNLATRPEISARIIELTHAGLQAADVTAKRVMLEIGRLAFSDVREVFDEDGQLRPISELSDDAAAVVEGVEFETRTERDGVELDLETGKEVPRFVTVKITKLKRAKKDAALTLLAKHFKLVGDEADGINNLANALSDRLKLARQRVPLVERINPEDQPP